MSHAPVLRAGDAPVKVKVRAGQTYVWCACGRSADQPFCDGSHKGTGIDPVVFKAERDDDVWLCMCKLTDTPPLCNGNHKKPVT
ncbi:CDGSH iron-sulfur domain-containing protein [Neptuniibacter sp. CAU 1671]|uniref:CDGSH iron-sulfur domain-containing protein n=1 Tax=Neptuniibacter sp. CAU 1671 TaxID=3032593 RepID=UPI0023DA16AB|nr:CDGSH iron-sulfur domain-containing protein [Neptuniibacter sp. CAU 1671]MDF2180439.1 CDGSH iron-sulfur domain-containing protein [Neptuniibacter sp. CAU 1671]